MSRKAALALLPLLAACATNPATQRRQLMVISEEKEIRLGEDADKEIRRRFGVYEESVALQRYVDDVGERLVEVGERPDLVFHFQILDTPEVNAFALPGGFLYVTRGMLEQLNTEDELAVVMGHEIGHVTGRHGAAMISKALVARWALFTVAVFEPGVAAWADAINLAVAIAFEGYSRKYENQADHLGVRYVREAGYNPAAALTVIDLIERLEKEEGRKVVWFLRSHPPAEVRRENTDAALAEVRAEDPAVLEREQERREYVRRLDGLVVGKGIAGVVVAGDTYTNKRLGFQATVPPVWELEVRPAGAEQDEILLVARDEEKKRFLYWQVDPMNKVQTLEEVVADFEKHLGKEDLRPAGPKRYDTTAAGEPIFLGTYAGKTQIEEKRQPVTVLVGILVHGKYIFKFYGFTLVEAFEGLRPTLEEAARSAAFPSAEELDALQPLRLRVVAAAEGDTWAALAERWLGNPDLAARLARYNGFPPEEGPAPGTLLKIPPAL